MHDKMTTPRINLAIAGIGNCASSLIEGICYYREHSELDEGLLFPVLGGYSVADIDVVAAIDISSAKVGRALREAIYQPPNNFVRVAGVSVSSNVKVERGPTLDGNPPHLSQYVTESVQVPVNVPELLADRKVDVLLNLLPTGSNQATEFYARAAAEAGCAFVNCIPSILAQNAEFQSLFSQRGLPLLGDDIKSQMGTTILHRALLHLLELRGAKLEKTSQINVGGNMDFANFVHRAESKLISKRKSVQAYLHGADFHVGHHYDPTRSAMKTAFIELEAAVFAGSRVRISMRLDSDDKPNAAGSICDLVRIAKIARDKGIGGYLPEPCAFYMKSPPEPMDDAQAFEHVRAKWVEGAFKT